jgi:hypothetical protein
MSDFRLERGKTSLGLNLRYRRAGHNNCPFRAGSRIALVVQIVIRGKIAFYVSRGVRRLWKMVWVEREWPLCEQVTDRVLGIEVDAVELLWVRLFSRLNNSQQDRSLHPPQSRLRWRQGCRDGGVFVA